MKPIYIALVVVLVLGLLAAGYYSYTQRGACETAADCTAGQICQAGKCAAPSAGLGVSPPARTSAQPEVFSVDMGRYGLTYAEAQSAAATWGATVATLGQLTAAQAAGAEWCWSGWVSTGAVGGGGLAAVTAFPMQTVRNGCAPSPGVYIASAAPTPAMTAGVTLYGVKPQQGTHPVCGGSAGLCVMPFNATRWSQYS